MTAFTIFDSTGRVLRSGSAPVGMLSIQCGPGEDWLPEADPDPGNTYVASTPTGPMLTPFPPRPSVWHEWDWPTLDWVLPASALGAAQAQRAKEMSAACKQAIYAGFESSALGAPHTYPAKDLDQSNLIASITDSLLHADEAGWVTPFWCCDAAGVWTYTPHTAAQIQQVGIDGKAAIVACLLQNATRAAQINAAATIEAVEAITWEGT